MKRYRLVVDRDAEYDGIDPWCVEQLYPWSKKDPKKGNWCVIARFYRRNDARLFLKAIKAKCGKPPKVKPLLPSSEQLQQIAQQLRRDRLFQQLRDKSVGNPA